MSLGETDYNTTKKHNKKKPAVYFVCTIIALGVSLSWIFYSYLNSTHTQCEKGFKQVESTYLMYLWL